MITENITYFLYARKSSESEDRQMASIDDQVQVIEKLALDKGITITKVFQESKSAKAPGRPVFNEMLARIEKGEAQGIICWKLNRLSRNPIDGGRISWLLQNSVIKHIQCNSSSYKPSDNVLMMAVELGMANQFIKDLSTDVQRGMRAKATRGWFPSPVLPIGYLHNKSTKRKVEPIEIIKDPVRFPIIKKLWKLMATGRYNITDIKRKADAMGLRSDRKKPYAISTFHNMFASSFYYGVFKWKNEDGSRTEIHGKHKPMISKMDYLKVRALIENQSKLTRPKQYEFLFRGWLRCGECKSAITAEHKKQVRCTNCHYKFSCKHRQNCSKCLTPISKMDNPNFIDKTYYRCVKKRGTCSQRYVEQEALKKQFIAYLNTIKIPESFATFILNVLEQQKGSEANESIELLHVLKKQKSELINRKEGLINMRADGDIDQSIFQSKLKEIQVQVSKLDKEIIHLEHAINKWKDTAKLFLDIGKMAQEIIESGDINRIRNLLPQFGSNQYILDKSLYIISPKPLLALSKCYQSLNSKKTWLEPENPLEKQGDSGGFDTSYPILCPALAEVRTSIYQYNSLNNSQVHSHA